MMTESVSKRLKVLIADDDARALALLTYLLTKWGYEVVTASDGRESWDMISHAGVQMAILDWNMPEMEGPEVARWTRLKPDKANYVYIIILTARDSVEDVIEGLSAGADDYLRKPYDEEELHSRLRTGERIVELERTLVAHAAMLQEALDNNKVLSGLLPICGYCKKIRDDKNYWEQVEGYIIQHTDAKFTHSVCPECHERQVKPMLDEMKKARLKY